MPSISETQLDALGLLCNASAVYHMADADVRAYGITLESESGRRFVNPSAAVMETERRTIIKLSKAFGVAPDDGARTGPESSPFAELLTRDS